MLVSGTISSQLLVYNTNTNNDNNQKQQKHTGSHKYIVFQHL